MTEAVFQLGAGVAGGLRQLTGEGRAQVVRAHRAELAVGVGGLQVADPADVADGGVDGAGDSRLSGAARRDRGRRQKQCLRDRAGVAGAFGLQLVGRRGAGVSVS
ncbi:hypothetical protein GCM10017600_26890 [Streptosporangium carneum]|uniref:Uncharacterized protein n=1 Tax=Streptosporangium carneum TaxID=47481 RepID=A0A9W6MD08_9ACTN|nr:hypothetical protein GCM10017600_26890 [Streptosporangium carneum]